MPNVTFTPNIWWVAPLGSIVALVFAVIYYSKLMKSDEGTDKMKEIAGYVKEGAMAYLFRQYKSVSIVFACLFVILFLLALNGIQNPFVPVGKRPSSLAFAPSFIHHCLVQSLNLRHRTRLRSTA